MKAIPRSATETLGHAILPVGSQRLPPQFHISLFASSAFLFRSAGSWSQTWWLSHGTRLSKVLGSLLPLGSEPSQAASLDLSLRTLPLPRGDKPQLAFMTSSILGLSTIAVTSHSPIVFLGFSWCQASATLHGLFMPLEKQYHLSDCYILTTSAASMRCSLGPL